MKKWTRGVDIFSKDFVFIPIVEASHWYLAVVCFSGLTKGSLFHKSSGLPYSGNLQNVNLFYKVFIAFPIMADIWVVLSFLLMHVDT